MDIFPIRRPPDEPTETLVPDLSDGAEAGLYLALFELVEEGLIITSDETILEVNSAACHLLDRTYPQLVGKPLAELFPSEAAFLAARGALFVDGASRGSLSLRMPDGQRRHLRCLAAARVRPGVHALVLSPDTAGLAEPRPPKRSEEKVWPRLAAAVREPVLVVDGNGLIQAANATAQTRFGKRGASLLGTRIAAMPIDSAQLRRLPGPHPGWELLILPPEGRDSSVVQHPVEERYRRSFRHLPYPALLCEQQSQRILDANEAAAAAYGLTRQALLAKSMSDLVIAEGSAKAALAAGPQRHRDADGKAFEVQLEIEALPLAGKRRELLLIHRPLATPSPAQQYAAELFALSAEGVLVLDDGLRILALNPATPRICGLDRQALLGKPVKRLLQPLGEDPFAALARGERKHWRGEMALVTGSADGARAAVQVARIAREAGRPAHYLVTLRLAAPAGQPSAAPGHPARGPLGEDYRRLARDARENRRKLALMSLDIDDFHRVNAQHGEAVADGLLAEIGRRLGRTLPAEAVCVRAGADSFLVIVSALPGTAEARHLAEALLDAVAAPLAAGSGVVNLSASIGVALQPDHAEDLSGLVSAAELALAGARRDGPPVRLFDPAERERALARTSLDAAIRRAPDNGELALHWQPRYSLDGARMVGAEALLRWQHPQLGLLDAEQFVPAAMRSGAIDALGRWAQGRACEQMAAWHEAHGCNLVVSVNVSALELGREGFAARLLGAIEQHALRPATLEIELGEGGAILDDGIAMANLYRLQENGVRIVLDRFGSAGTPLSALRHIPACGVKIDPQFVRDLSLCDEGPILVGAIVSAARGLGLEVIAAGVEHAEQRDRLARLGCDASQGRLHGAPMSSEAFGRMLAAAYRRG